MKDEVKVPETVLFSSSKLRRKLVVSVASFLGGSFLTSDVLWIHMSLYQQLFGTNYLLSYLPALACLIAVIIWFVLCSRYIVWSIFLAFAVWIGIVTTLSGYLDAHVYKLPLYGSLSVDELHSLNSQLGFRITEYADRDGTYLAIANDPNNARLLRGKLSQLGIPVGSLQQ
jgi:hypothetical protein